MDKKTYKKIMHNKGYYLPLFNFNGAYSSITPYFAGDFKTDYHHYALKPISELGLFNLDFSRNIYFDIHNERYKLNGDTLIQKDDEISYKYDMLYQTVIRSNSQFELVTTSFLAPNTAVELHEVVIKNKTKKPLKMDITTAIPLYGRSANNIFDHRHVTSLLHVTKVVDEGIIVKPTLSFDERGHQLNDTYYGVFTNLNSLKANRYIPVLDDFIGGGSLSMPNFDTSNQVGDVIKGYETIGAIGYDDIVIDKLGEVKLYFSIAISDTEDNLINDGKKYLNETAFYEALKTVQDRFIKETSYIDFQMLSHKHSEQLKWVTLQPILRRYFGNSYMPHHDYGHGGRGWRDLWQDLLSLIVSNDASVKEVLYNNFKGVRIDGSNATIIGHKPGEFSADRNKIVRVWSDHGCWPLLTTKMYIDETGDLGFLLQKQTYFDDQFTHYTKATKNDFSKNNVHPYEGSILEHLLLQNLVGYFNTGKNGFTRLEDADWNDGLDMANNLGETIAFTHFYAQNLKVLASLIEALPDDEITMFESLYDLLLEKIDIHTFFDNVSKFNETSKTYEKLVIIGQLKLLSKTKKTYLNHTAWFDTYYQSYINNDGKFQDKVNQMSLTGQAMALLHKTPDDEQASQIAQSTKKLLFDERIGGYRLNSNYNEVLTNMGRAYGFAYGHKENGAVFSHMVIMYAYGLYVYDLVDEGSMAYLTLLERALHEDSGVLAGIPEYFNDRGIGKYSYLTGSASWLIKLLRTEVFGIQMHLGKLSLKPKLSKHEFIDHKAIIQTYLFGQKSTIVYHNPKNLNYKTYKISRILIDGVETNLRQFDKRFNRMDVYLDEYV